MSFQICQKSKTNRTNPRSASNPLQIQSQDRESEMRKWGGEETDPPHLTKKITHHLWTLPIPLPVTHSSSSRSETAGLTCGTHWLGGSYQVVVAAMNEGDERWELWPRGTESEIKKHC